MATRTKQPKPRWDARTRRLWLGEILVKEFHRIAPSQELLLTSFEEQDWQEHCDNPLPGGEGKDTHESLRNAVKRLDRATRPLIRFHLDGTGRGVFWRRG
jgi:hypothetical protein